MGLGAGVVGGILSGNKLKEQEAIYNQRMSDIKAHRDNVYYRDPTQTAENQAALTQAKEVMNEQTKRAAGTAAVTGGTPEAVALAKKQASETVGNILQQQAVQGAQQKEQAWQQADTQLDAYSKYLADSKAQQAASIAQAAGGLSKGLGNLPV